MNVQFKEWLHKLYPSELEHSIETVMRKFEMEKEEDRELIYQMMEQLQEKLEFDRLASYNVPGSCEEGYEIKHSFKNDKYEEELEQLVNTIHLNNGIYDLVLKRIRQYHEYQHNRTRIAETLKKLPEYENNLTIYEKDGASSDCQYLSYAHAH